ncbi:hypothetical protein LWF01_08100 [Saxibacter everestensis]|uniref:Uncharacterized protein n=1 Tax=Saxibacter everestensis TaxID=2909229 RepID=A0ABY8QZU2_9MICO|nr:hypothetical protein LWF01_08100 [Brevibacteriaceae bacterium ZFBP1038]
MTAWMNGVLCHRTGIDHALDAITGDNDLAPVVAADDVFGLPAGAGISLLAGALRQADVTSLRLALPVPGDVSMLPATPGLAEAMSSGQAVVAETAGVAAAVLVPCSLRPAGQSLDDYVSRSEWRIFECAPVRYSPVASSTLGEAERAMKEAVLEALGSLAEPSSSQAFPLAAWQEGNVDRARGVLSAGDDVDLPGASPRAVRVASMALRMLALTEAAPPHELGFSSHHEEHAQLDFLNRAARQALVLAVNDTRP